MVTDLTYLKNMSGGDTEIIKEMIGIFNEQVQEYMIDMPKLLAEKNYFALGKLAHKAKSSVSIMGMTSVAADLKSLELQTKDNLSTESYPKLVDNFVVQCGLAVAELTEILKKM
jgi:HPt (histidine-containing phosphotransfer) domain-containing protein